MATAIVCTESDWAFDLAITNETSRLVSDSIKITSAGVIGMKVHCRNQNQPQSEKLLSVDGSDLERTFSCCCGQHNSIHSQSPLLRRSAAKINENLVFLHDFCVQSSGFGILLCVEANAPADKSCCSSW
jgi:hypothetical protein